MAPVTFTQGTHGGGTSSATLTVIATTGAGDALVLSFGLTGSAPPTISTITDTKSNTWVSSNSVGTNPALYVWRATGATAALVSGTDTLTVTFSGNTPAGWAHSGVDAPGVATADINVTNSAGAGNATVSSGAGGPAQSGETALAFFVWSNAGGTGTMNSPFIQLDQQHPTSSAFLTTGYDLNPPTGTTLTASDTITSTAWRANLLTLEASAVSQSGSPPLLVPPGRQSPVSLGLPAQPVQAPQSPPSGQATPVESWVPPGFQSPMALGIPLTAPSPAPQRPPSGQATPYPLTPPGRQSPVSLGLGVIAPSPAPQAPPVGQATPVEALIPPGRLSPMALSAYLPPGSPQPAPAPVIPPQPALAPLTPPGRIAPMSLGLSLYAPSPGQVPAPQPTPPGPVIMADDGDAPWHIRSRRRRT